MNSIIAIPRAAVSVRVATIEDLPFIDGLQKQHRKHVGFLMMKAIEAKIEKGEILIAEERMTADYTDITDRNELVNQSETSASSAVSIPVGYCIGVDRYFKREDCGIVYQLNVVPGKQRAFVGATLLKAMFDRASYSCKLFCCWCAQDIKANYFWEAMGFVPVAFRAGSEKKSRIHIFWQKRIREGDMSTGWWFPSQTTGGSIGAGRIVLPIPPGTHWSDAKPMVLPSEDKILLQEQREVREKTKKNVSVTSPRAFHILI